MLALTERGQFGLGFCQSASMLDASGIWVVAASQAAFELQSGIMRLLWGWERPTPRKALKKN